MVVGDCKSNSVHRISGARIIGSFRNTGGFYARSRNIRCGANGRTRTLGYELFANWLTAAGRAAMEDAGIDASRCNLRWQYDQWSPQ